MLVITRSLLRFDMRGGGVRLSTAPVRRRHSLSTMLCEVQTESAPQNADVLSTLSSSAEVALSLSSTSSPAFISPSHYSKQFQRITSEQQTTQQSSRFSSAGTQWSVANQTGRNTSDDNMTALEELAAVQSANRRMFATAPRVQLQKSKSLLRKERAAAAKAAEVKGDGSRPQHVPTTVAVPLFPPEFLQQRAVSMQLKGKAGMVTQQDVNDDVEQLHMAAARNHLSQSDESQLFRCLRCFHVFPARPSTILSNKADQFTRAALDEEERKRQDAALASNIPCLKKRMFSIGQRQRRFLQNPNCCPHCSSTKVQWAMEYCHHRTHSKVRV